MEERMTRNKTTIFPEPERKITLYGATAVLITFAALAAIRGNARNDKTDHTEFSERAYPPRVIRALGPTENKFRDSCDGKSDVEVRDTDFSDILKERDAIITREGYKTGKEAWSCERADNNPYDHRTVITVN